MYSSLSVPEKGKATNYSSATKL